MNARTCDGCGEHRTDVQMVKVSTGRGYPGVGGPMSPPEHAALCADCREERRPEVDDVECGVCGELIENHHLDDPPFHADCDPAELEVES